MYNNILIPIDPDYPDSFDALVDLALQVSSDSGKISTLYVNKNYIHHRSAATSPDLPTEIEAAVVAQVTEKFRMAVPENRRGEVYTRRGVVHDQILRVSEHTAIDLIIMSPNKRPWVDYLLGSTTRRVATEARCSVFVKR